MKLPVLIGMFALVACEPDAAPQEEPAGDEPVATTVAGAEGLESDDDKTLYALGLAVGSQLELFDLAQEDLAHVKRGMTDAVLGAEPEVDLEVYGPRVEQLAQQRMQARAEAGAAEGQAFLAEVADEPEAQQLDSGMVYIPLEEGDGPSPTSEDEVVVHYRGTLTDGSQFDASYDRGEPATFPLGGVIPCWTEGVQKMQVGGKARLVCPPEMAYGPQGRPGIPPNSTLDFEVELIEITGTEG